VADGAANESTTQADQQELVGEPAGWLRTSIHIVTLFITGICRQTRLILNNAKAACIATRDTRSAEMFRKPTASVL
jgi:hypothetical protein